MDNISRNENKVDWSTLLLSLNNASSQDNESTIHTQVWKPQKIAAVILSIIGILANISSILAISKTRGRLTSNLRLIVSLCCGDVMVSVGIFAYVAHQAATAGNSEAESQCTMLILRCFRIFSHIIALLNLLGLAVDHYMAIVKPLDYPSLMNRGRANVLIISFWISALILGFSKFYIPYPLFSYCDPATMSNYCELVFCSKFNGEYIMFSIAIISFVLMSFCYARIYFALKRCHAFQAELRNSVKKNRKGLITTLVIVLIFLLCWLPYCLFNIAIVISLQIYANDFLLSLKYFKLMNEVDYYLFDILLLNSILDPFIYAVRMAEIQRGYRHLFRIFLCKRSSGKGAMELSFRRKDSGSHCNTTVTLIPNAKNGEYL